MSNICYIRRNKRHNTCIITSSKYEGLSTIGSGFFLSFCGQKGRTLHGLKRTLIPDNTDTQ